MDRQTLRAVVLAAVVLVLGCAEARAPAAPQDEQGADAGADAADAGGGGQDAEEDRGANNTAADTGDGDIGGDDAPDDATGGDDVGGEDAGGDDTADGEEADASGEDAGEDTTPTDECGDGEVDPGEDCDDGNTSDQDACPTSCQRALADLCRPCSSHGGCGGPADLCVGLADGAFCALACDDVVGCPEGFVCEDTDVGARQCLPAAGVCAPCYDPDGDGFGVGVACQGADCAEGNGAVHPGASEVCDGGDQDCDGAVDEGLARVTVWSDGDGDGFGAMGAAPVEVCAPGAGQATNADDCDDLRGDVHPGAQDVCDGVDNDCNGSTDEGAATTTLWPDTDGDGYGDGQAAPTSLCGGMAGFVANGDDCDDRDNTRSPGAGEACNARDDDCDGVVDDGAPCPCAVEQQGGHAYLFCAQPGSWTSAQAACAANGYRLVTINDAAENTWIFNQSQSLLALCGSSCRYNNDNDCDDGGPGYDYDLCTLGSDCIDCGPRVPTRVWIGYSDRAVEGVWVWEGGPNAFTLWNGGEPNNSGGEDCGELYLDDGAGRWNDKECGEPRPWVCESP